MKGQVYIDACAINRLYDDPAQTRIQAEAHAMVQILSFVLRGEVQWIASRALELELMRNPDEAKRKDALTLLHRAGVFRATTGSILQRGRELAGMGYGNFDALHLAHAEEASVDAFLTTDDRLVRRAVRRVGKPSIRVTNPLEWLREVSPWLL